MGESSSKSSIVFALVAALLAQACSGGGGYDTRRDAALAIGDAYCNRAAECIGDLSAAEIDECIDVVVGEVCAESSCSEPPSGSDDDIDTCIDALWTHACSAESLPAECNAVL